MLSHFMTLRSHGLRRSPPTNGSTRLLNCFGVKSLNWHIRGQNLFVLNTWFLHSTNRRSTRSTTTPAHSKIGVSRWRCGHIPKKSPSCPSHHIDLEPAEQQPHISILQNNNTQEKNPYLPAKIRDQLDTHT